jgi:hypothetical protein
MTMFMAVHTMPVTEAQALEMAKNMKLPAGFTWKQTYCDFPGQKFFCEWQAPNKDALAKYFQEIKMPFDAIYPVKLFDVAKRDFVK